MSLLAVMGAGTLAAIAHAQPAPDPLLQYPLYQEFLFACIAALSFALGMWLYRETQRAVHPSVCCLSVGFFAQSLIFAAATIAGPIWNPLRNAAALGWFNIFFAGWVVLFASAAALLLVAAEVRHRFRAATGNRYAAMALSTALLFAAYSVVILVLWRVFRDHPQVRAFYGLELLVGAVAMLAALRFYRRRRRPIVLSQVAGLFLFLLSQFAATASPPWHLLWWCGYILYFCALLLVGYGVLEGHRVFEREDLIARLAELTAQLEEQSVRDPLTGSYNRRHMMSQLEAEFKKAHRGRLPLTLLVGDLDDFKRINDTYGHLCGDHVLREAARRLSASVRATDIVARCGGEEFWILLPMTNRMGGREVAGKTLEAIGSEPYVWESAELTMTMSIGIADTFCPGVTDVATLLREADRGLYAAKRAGKNRVAITDPLAFSVPAEQ